MNYQTTLDLIKKYPKKRGVLPKPIRKIFNKYYSEHRNNFLSQLSERWLHTSINDRNIKNTTLEIGAGTLNHLKYEIKKHYDIIEPKSFLYKNSINKKLINKKYADIKLTPDNNYNRIISCAVLEHIADLPDYLYVSSLKLKKGGYQQHSIPCEGYPMWDILWFMFSGILFRLKFGYSFRYIQKHEHVNNFDEIKSLISFFYKKVEIKFSYPFYNKYLSFYANIKFRNPNKKNILIYKKQFRQKKPRNFNFKG
jgi:hypothetical protein